MGPGTALALTLAVESLVILAARVPWPRVLAAALLPSLLTHPLAWRAALALPADGYLCGVLLIETAVVLVEAVVLRVVLQSTRWSSWRAAFALSLLANAASYATGLLVQVAQPASLP